MSSLGILSFMLLDLFDGTFSIYKLSRSFGKSENDVKLLKKAVSNQLGMTSM